MNHYEYHLFPPNVYHNNDTRTLQAHLRYLNSFCWCLQKKILFIRLFNMEPVLRNKLCLDPQGRLIPMAKCPRKLKRCQKETLKSLIEVVFFPAKLIEQGSSVCGVL